MTVLDLDDIVKSHGQESNAVLWPEVVSLLSQSLDEKKSLTVKGTGDEQIAALSKALGERPLPLLQTLRLHWKRLSEAGFVELAAVILSGNLSALQTFHMANSFEREKYNFGIGDAGLISLISALASGGLPSLKALQIGDFNKALHSEIFSLEGAKALAELLLLGSIPQLEDLRLDNLHSEEGVVAVLSGLEFGLVGKIKKLRLQGCEIGLDGALALASVLQSPNFSCLETLNVQDNVGQGLGDDGIVVLCTAFRTANMDQLKNAWLHDVGMGERGLTELASVLEEGHLSSLKHLYIAGAEWMPAATEAFLKGYRENSALVAVVHLTRPKSVLYSDESESEVFDYETDEDDLRTTESRLEELRSRNEKLMLLMQKAESHLTAGDKE